MKIALVNNKCLVAGGLILIGVGILANEWVLAKVFSPSGTLALFSRIQIWIFNLTLITTGFVVITSGLDFRRLRWISLGLLLAAVSVLLAGYFVRMSFTFQIDYNEGWNVYQSMHAISGETLYDVQNRWTPVNYPPISFYLVGGLGQLLDSPLLAGRYISFFSLLLVSVLVGYIVKHFSGEINESVFSSIFCLGLFAVYARGYVGMNDPQLLGHVFMLSALFLYLKKPRHLLPVALLCAAGLFTKHNLIPLFLAITADIFLRSRRDFLSWLGYHIFIVGGFALFIHIVLGSDFLYQLTTNRGYDVNRIIYWVQRLGWLFFLYIIITIPWLIYTAKKSAGRIIPLYLAFSVAFGFFTSGGTGTDVNMFFDIFISLSITIGLLLSYANSTFQHLIPVPYLLSFIWPIVFGFGLLVQRPHVSIQEGMLAHYVSQEEAFLEDAAFLSTKGSILCSNILLCYSANKPFEVDPFLTTEAIIAGRMDESDILVRLEVGYFGIVQMNYAIDGHYFEGLPYTTVKPSNTLFTENFLRALGKHYILTRETPTGFFYEYKEEIISQ
jgi:hypothetical protein